MDHGSPQAAEPAETIEPAGDAPPQYLLRGLNAQSFGRTFPLTGPMTLGRAFHCDLYFDVPNLSREHARMSPTEDGIRITDLNSTNGTFVNSVRVLETVAVAGDELQFDQLRFLLLDTGVHRRTEQKQIVHAPPARRLVSGREVITIMAALFALLLVLAAIGLLAFMPGL
jgi:hypothetical protein